MENKSEGARRVVAAGSPVPTTCAARKAGARSDWAGPVLTVVSAIPDLPDLSETRDLRPRCGMMIRGRRIADSNGVAVGTQRRFPAFPLAATAGAAPTGKNVAGVARAACVVSHRRRPQQPRRSVADKDGDSRKGKANWAKAFLGKGRPVAFRVGCLVGLSFGRWGSRATTQTALRGETGRCLEKIARLPQRGTRQKANLSRIHPLPQGMSARDDERDAGDRITLSPVARFLASPFGPTFERAPSSGRRSV